MVKRMALAIALLLNAALGLSAASDNYTVIVSLDGFRWDYAEAFDTPFFDEMASEGVTAVMMPSFPSKTFPNHYTLATGLYPDHHGIISNEFKVRETGKFYSLKNDDTRNDPQYYGGDPIWLTAKRQGVKSATVYWVGSDVAVRGDRPTYWKQYGVDMLTFQQRADEVVRLLSLPKNERPGLVMCYFEEPDHSGHIFGPITKETRQATQSLDSLLSSMWKRLQALPIAGKVNLIVTGDHGMAWIGSERQIKPSQVLKKEWIDTIANDLPTLVYVRKPQYADSVVNALARIDHLRVWKRGEVPAYLNYGNNKNMGDVIVLPDLGWYFSDQELPLHAGTHGFDHTFTDMQVGFRAIGPDFKQGYTRQQEFRNVDIYPLLCHLLGIKPSPCDGDLDEVKDMLR